MRVPPPGSIAGKAELPHVGELFVDREGESEAFKVALAKFRRYIDAVDDVGIARHNLLTFYGLGGVGKSALSKRLEDWVNYDLPLDSGWGPPPATRVAATARIDLHGSAGQIDVLAVLLALRSGVSNLRPRWPIFDLALAAYWSAVRPGEPLPQFGGGDELSSAVLETLSDAIGDLGSLAEFVGTGTGTGLGLRGVQKLIRVLRRRRDVRLGIEAFPGFEGFLLRCAEEPKSTDPQPKLACEIAGALAWELSNLKPPPIVTVFIDSAERLSLDPRRISEGHLNTLIHQMPNVLFVVSGRDILDWSDEVRVDLPHRGASVWPGLVPGANAEPRQHLVGSLSPADTRTVILLGRRKLHLPLSDYVVEELVTASGGLPQYLELARQVAISIRDSGNPRQVRVADVTGSLGSLVRHVLDGIPTDEQRAVRAACLFRVFDADLVAAAANVDYGCAERAVLRPMIDRYEGERFPYRMHDAVREAIRTTDHHVSGGWSERDWQQAASRAAAAAHRLHDQAKNVEDSRSVLDALGIAIRLVCDQDVVLEPSSSVSYADWLSMAIVYGPSVQALRSRVPAASRTGYGQHVLNFIAAKSIETPVEERIKLLRAIFDSAHPLRLPAGRHLGYTLKLQHRWDEAIAVFDEVVSLAPTPTNIGQRPQVLSLARRFVDAKDAAGSSQVAAMIERMAEYAHGRPERYFAEIGSKLSRLRTAGRQREYLEELGDFYVRRALFRQDLTEGEVGAFLEEAESIGHIVAIRSALLATVLEHKTDTADTESALHRLRMLDQASGANGMGFRYALAEFCDARLQESDDRLKTLSRESESVVSRSRSWIPIECFFASVDLPLAPVPTQWLEPYGVVAERWTQHLRAYINRHLEID